MLLKYTANGNRNEMEASIGHANVFLLNFVNYCVLDFSEPIYDLI